MKKVAWFVGNESKSKKKKCPKKLPFSPASWSQIFKFIMLNLDGKSYRFPKFKVADSTEKEKLLQYHFLGIYFAAIISNAILNEYNSILYPVKPHMVDNYPETVQPIMQRINRFVLF